MCVRMGSPRQGWDVGQVMGALFLQVLVAQGLPWAPLLSQGISQEFPGWIPAGMGAGYPLLRISPGAAPALVLPGWRINQGVSQVFPGWTVVGWELGMLCSG